MITSLYLEGFKSFGKPVTIDFRDITLLYGENSSGKSSILQALQYAREVFCNGNLDCLKTEIGGDFVDLRGFENFVNGRDEDKKIRLGITVEVCDDFLAKHQLIDCSYAWPYVKRAINLVPVHEDIKIKWKEMHNHLESNDAGAFALPSASNLKEPLRMTVVLQIAQSAKQPRAPEITGMDMLLGKEQLVSIQKSRFGADCSISLKHSLMPAVFPDANTHAELYTMGQFFHAIESFGTVLDQTAGFEQMDEQGISHDKIPSDAGRKNAETESEDEREASHRDELERLFIDARNSPTSGWKDRLGSLAADDAISWTGNDWWGISIKHINEFSENFLGWPISALMWEEPDFFDESEREGMSEDELVQWRDHYDLYLNGFSRPLDIDDLKDLNLAGLWAGSMLIQASNEITNHLSEMQYIGPLRRHYSPPAQHRNKTDERSWADGLGAWDHLFNSPASLVTVNKWLSDPLLFGFDCTVQTTSNLIAEADELLRELEGEDAGRIRRILNDLNSDGRVIITSKDGYRLNSTDVGVGFSQVLPIIVAARGPAPACILLEQPELHIHVRLQAVLGDLLATGIVPDTPWQRSKRQFIVETHSEALLLRLMRRIRETTKEIVNNGPRLLCDHVAIYHISKEDGNSIAKKIELDTYGNLTDYWPDDLFDISLKERFGE